MTCAEARDLYSDWLDGVLEGPARDGLEAHFGACPECRRDVERFRRTVALVRDLGPARAPAGFAERVLGAVGRAPRRRRVIRQIFFPLPIKLPLQAAALVLVAVTAVFLFRGTPELERSARREDPAGPAPVGAARPAAEPGGRKAPEPEVPAAVPPAGPGSAEGEVKGEVKKEGQDALTPPAEPRTSLAAPPAGERQTDAVARAQAPAPEGGDRAGRTQRDEEATPRSRPAPRQILPAEQPTSEALGPIGHAADVAGVLRARDREAARAAVEDVVARVGGRRLSRRDEADAIHLDLVVPREGWAELVRTLEQIGPWTPERLPPALPSEVRVTLRIGG